MQVVFEHEIHLKNKQEEVRITQSSLWNALTFVLLNRPKFSDLFSAIEVTDLNETATTVTKKVKVQLHSDSWIEEEICFYPEKKILITLEAGAHHPTSSIDIELICDEENDYSLRFSYAEDLEEKKQLNQDFPEALENLRHQAWKMKDAELVSGVLELLLKENH